VSKAAARVAAMDILAAAADKDALCLGTRDGGLWIRDRAAGKWTAFSKADALPTNCVARVAIDDRSIWCAFGQAPLGVGRFDRKTRRWGFYTHREGVPCNHIYCLTRHGGSLFVGTLANGLWEYVISEDRWVNLNLSHRAEHEPVRRADIYCMCLANRVLWCGTTRGLCRYEPGAAGYEVIGGLGAPVTAVMPVQGRLLVGTRRRGVHLLQATRRTWIKTPSLQGLGTRCVTCLARTPGRIWVGTASGLIGLDAETLRPLPVPKRLARLHVTALLSVGKGLLVGSPSGLDRWAPEGSRVTPRALAGHRVLCLARSGRWILAGTASGLAGCCPADTAADANWLLDPGLRGRCAAALASDAKGLWIGTLGHGLIRARFDPRR